MGVKHTTKMQMGYEPLTRNKYTVQRLGLPLSWVRDCELKKNVFIKKTAVAACVSFYVQVS